MYPSGQQQSSRSNYKKLHNHWHQQPVLQRCLVTPMRALANHPEVLCAPIPNYKTEAQPLYVLLRL